jgi:hypothetical protein
MGASGWEWAVFGTRFRHFWQNLIYIIPDPSALCYTAGIFNDRRPRMPAKPPRYWDDFTVLERELLAFIDEHGVPGVMPTQQLLHRAGRHDLMRGIRVQGGVGVTGDRLGLAHHGRRKPHGYWRDPANVDRELLAFVAQHGKQGVMPTQQQMVQAGRADLALAITRSGGQRAVAERLGLRPADPRRAPGYWTDFANVARELAEFVAEPGRPPRMPTRAELLAAGRYDLTYAVQRHGGFGAAAERLGLETASHSRGPNSEPGS